MAEAVIHVRATRAEVRDAVHQAVAAACGRGQRGGDVARQMLTRVGMAALGRIKAAFVVKAAGGTDDCGLRWPPLAKSTVAYSRRHPGVPKSNVRAAFSPSWMLTDKQRKRWWELYRRFLGTAPSGAGYHAKGMDRGWASARAWAIVKAEGARTLMSVYGDEKVQILRDTGLLLNSLSPGIPGTINDQVFAIGRGDVIVGTNRKWAGVHHHGSSRVPQRRLWAEPSRWPQSWWDDIESQARQGLIEILEQMLRNL